MRNLGIILAGGLGTRLYPITQVVSKQLLPVYNKPMVYYPLSTLLAKGCEKILVITNPQHTQLFEALLMNSVSRFGASIYVRSQERPRGLADALIIAGRFLDEIDEQATGFVLALGDNLFYGPDFHEISPIRSTAQIHTYPVPYPQNYGVFHYHIQDGRTVRKITEKPKNPLSRQAVIGLYEYPTDAAEYAMSLSPSARGELEITDLNNIYLEEDRCNLYVHNQPSVWMDMGTPSNLLETASFIQAVENRTGTLVGAPELAAGRVLAVERGLPMIINSLPELYPPNSPYTEQLMKILTQPPL